MMRINNFYSDKVFLAIVSLAFLITACDTSGVSISNAEEYKNIYMPQATDVPKEKSIVLKDEIQEVIFGAAYAGPGAPSSDIQVNFEFTPEKLDSFNETRGTDYSLLPEEAFELGATSATIPADELASAPLKLGVNPFAGLELETPYLFPLAISSVDGDYKLNEELKTTYFKFIVTVDLFDRSNWEVVDVSSEETVGEGEDNGGAIHAIDGDIGTYWHTEWAGAQPDYPHHITIDMQEQKTISGFQLVNRQDDSRGMTRIRFEGSTDGETWTDLGEFEFKQINEDQKFFATSNPEVQYLKLVALEGPNFFTALAEMEAF